MLLAVAGIYGVLAGNVAERTREIGLRTALGATPRNILQLVVGQGARLAVVGLSVGLFGAFALTRSLRALLFGVGPNDPATTRDGDGPPARRRTGGVSGARAACAPRGSEPGVPE